MPTYDYVCASCGHEMEVMRSVHSEGPSACPKCGGPMKKTFAAPAVHFKGSGWARKERSSAGKPGRVERKETGGSSGEGAESSAGGSGSSSGAESPAKDTAPNDASPKDAPAKDPD
jgi:putative FmdB family regulatory protein